MDCKFRPVGPSIISRGRSTARRHAPAAPPMPAPADWGDPRHETGLRPAFGDQEAIDPPRALWYPAPVLYTPFPEPGRQTRSLLLP